MCSLPFALPKVIRDFPLGINSGNLVKLLESNFTMLGDAHMTGSPWNFLAFRVVHTGLPATLLSSSSQAWFLAIYTLPVSAPRSELFVCTHLLFISDGVMCPPSLLWIQGALLKF